MNPLKILSLKLLLLLSPGFIFTTMAQQAHQYNLVRLLQQDKLIFSAKQQTRILDDTAKKAITSFGVVWLKELSFKEGVIEVDLRGKDVFLQSFLGIAFHAADTATYDVVYFRPFNFRHADTARRKWSVQYMSLPGYDYDKLRKEHPLVYENSVDPVPLPEDWFHAKIVIKNHQCNVYVNRSAKPSLTVTLLNNRADGNLGLWASGLSGDFANLTIQPKNN